MTGFWLASYIVLWVLVVILCLLMIGLLQQVGLLHRRLGQPTSDASKSLEVAMLPLEKDGPAINSSLPELTVETINGFGTQALSAMHNEGYRLLLFLASTCESCQHIVDSINRLLSDGIYDGYALAILRSDEQGCRAFLNVFPLHLPVVCDSERTITMSFEVHRNPFGLLYDRHGNLVRKGVVQRQEDLQALLGDPSVSLSAQANVFPPLSSSSALT